METTSTHRGSPKSDSREGHLQQAVRHGEEIIGTTAEDIGEAAQEVRAQFTSAIEAAKATYSRLQDKGVECSKATDRMVRKHPYPSLGLAFGGGVLIGLLCHRKS
jgi:ElaB/YqjD/DUF883 family membrane-anchored ribosome-binding protein